MSPSNTNTMIPFLTALAPSTAFFFSGLYFSASALTLPCLYSLPPSPSTVSIQTLIFTKLYHRGAAAAIPLAAVSTLAYSALAYLIPEAKVEYGTAAGLVAGTIGWTVVVMGGVNERLIEIGEVLNVKGGGRGNEVGSGAEREKLEREGSGEVEGLLKAWTWMNFVRSGLAGGAGFVGIWVALR